MLNNNNLPIVDQTKTLNEIIAELAWQVEQPNSHPLELYTPLIEAIGRRLYGPNSGSKERQIIKRLGLPTKAVTTD